MNDNDQRFAAYLEASEGLGDIKTPGPIQHPEILEQEVTCLGVPEVHEGRLLDGRKFYLRYRRGTAILGVGWTEDRTMFGPDIAHVETGHPLQGVFSDDQHRSETFALLLGRIYH